MARDARNRETRPEAALMADIILKSVEFDANPRQVMLISVKNDMSAASAHSD